MKLIILALSYTLVLSVQWFCERYGVQSSNYYLLLCLTSFVLFFVCFFSTDKIIEGYAYVQLIVMIIYAAMINPDWYWVLKPALYSWEINYANVILSYELIMLSVGLWNAIQIIIRFFNGSYMHSISNYGIKK